MVKAIYISPSEPLKLARAIRKRTSSLGYREEEGKVAIVSKFQLALGLVHSQEKETTGPKVQILTSPHLPSPVTERDVTSALQDTEFRIPNSRGVSNKTTVKSRRKPLRYSIYRLRTKKNDWHYLEADNGNGVFKW